MRTMILMAAMAMAMAGCMAGGEGAAVQEVAGPGGVAVTVRAAGQLAVSWSADAAAVQYRVLRSAGGGGLTFLDSVGGGGAPATSYIDTGLAAGVQYCYALESAYPDGSTSAVGPSGCGATGPITIPLPGTRTVRFYPDFTRNTAFASANCADGAGIERLCEFSTGAGAATIAVTYDVGLTPVSASVDVLGAASGRVNFGLTLTYAQDSSSTLIGIGQRVDSNRTAQRWGSFSVPVATSVPPLGPTSVFALLVGVDGAGYGIGDVTVTFQE